MAKLSERWLYILAGCGVPMSIVMHRSRVIESLVLGWQQDVNFATVVTAPLLSLEEDQNGGGGGPLCKSEG